MTSGWLLALDDEHVFKAFLLKGFVSDQAMPVVSLASLSVAAGEWALLSWALALCDKPRPVCSRMASRGAGAGAEP